METVTETTPHSGIDLSFADDAVRVQDDLYAHVNGAWLATHEIPADRSIDGSFLTLRDRAEENVRDLIVAASTSDAESGTDECKIGDLYASFMATDHIEALGIGPIRDELTAIDDITTADRLARRIGRLQRHGVAGLIGCYVDTDAKDSSRYLVHLSQSGLGLPDESYYRDVKHAQTRTAYRAHIEAVFALAALPDPATAAARVLDLETAIAAHHWDVVARRDAERSYNLLAYADFASAAGGFDVDEWIAGLGTTHEPVFAEVVVRQPDFISGVGELVATRPLEDWKAWLRWQLLHSAAPYLPQAFVDENFAVYGRTLSGAPELRERWKRGVAFVESAAGFAVGRRYVAKHLPATAKARIDELIANLVEAYRRNISDLEWMTPATRA